MPSGCRRLSGAEFGSLLVYHVESRRYYHPYLVVECGSGNGAGASVPMRGKAGAVGCHSQSRRVVLGAKVFSVFMCNVIHGKKHLKAAGVGVGSVSPLSPPQFMFSGQDVVGMLLRGVRGLVRVEIESVGESDAG